MIKIIIAKDFTKTPGARDRSDGDYSGQEFFEDILEPNYVLAKKDKFKLHIDLDNTWGYASSFISGSFGRLSKKYSSKEVLSVLEFKSNDQPDLINKIIKQIKLG